MEQSPFPEVNCSSASQQNRHILWNLKVHYHVHKGLPLVPVICHIYPVYNSNLFT